MNYNAPMTSSSYTPMWLLLFLILFAVLTVLQVYLSRKSNKWLGLIMPIMLFFIAIIVCTVILQNPRKIYVTTYFLTFLLYNIPTAIYLIIYAICRESLKKAGKMSQLDKMNIQDLE